MRAGSQDRLLVLDPDGDIVGIGIGTGGGADHKDTMIRLAHSLGVPFNAETVADARIDPTRVADTATFFDFRHLGQDGGTVFALNYRYSEIEKPISLDRLVRREGRTSLYSADEDDRRPTGLVTAWVDDALLVIAHMQAIRDYLVEVEAALRRGELALIRPDGAQGPFLVIADRVAPHLTLDGFKAAADYCISRLDKPGDAFRVGAFRLDLANVPSPPIR
jgi:hypothetical protein